MSREHERVDEAEFEEEDVTQAFDEGESSRGRRAAELMFSNTGRIAMGICGVLLFLGGVAAVSSYLFDDPAASKKKGALAKAKPAAKSPSPAAKEPDEPVASRAEGFVAPETERYAVEETAPATRQPSADERYADRNSDPFAAFGPIETPAADEAAPEANPADAAPEVTATEFESDPAAFTPGVTPVVDATPREPARQEPAEPRIPTRPYQARAGESVFDIARYELGSAGRWIEIYELNATTLRDQLDSLPGGTRLLIPQR